MPVAHTPEEKVRQALISFFLESGISIGLIGVELSLSALTHLAGKKTPRRRADIIVFSPQGIPLILVECKAVPLSDAAIRQVVGYNLFVGAPKIILANQTDAKTGVFKNNSWSFVDRLDIVN